MAIRVDSSERIFTLHTSKSTYQMKVDEQGVLLHTYFGASADETDFSYLMVAEDRGFCGQPAKHTKDRCYSMDVCPLEYPVHGNGDYRIDALKAGIAAKVPALDLRFVSYQILEGKYALEGLPALYAAPGDDAQTLQVVLKDLYEELYVTLYYGVFEKDGLLTRAAVIENRGALPVSLRRVMSMSLDLPDSNLDLVTFYGKHVGERQFERGALRHGITQISSTRGTSSHQQNPFVIICDRQTTEETGICLGVSLLYSGSFQIQAEVDQFERLRVICGIHEDEFCWELKPGEAFYTPETVLALSENGFAGLSALLARGYKEHLIRSIWKDRRRPALINNWEATYYAFDGGRLLGIAQRAAEIGLELLVLDDGWFGKRDDDRSGLGDWFVNEGKLGCTMRELSEQINALGLKFGIWIEPEMVSEDSDLYRSHPDWALTIPGRDPNRTRSQLVLDLSNREVIAYMKRCLDDLLSCADISYIKWDMNRSVDNICSAVNPQLSQGAIRHRYVLGVYEVMEYLHGKYPELLIEGCSGGGGRFDAGMLYYVPQIWCSDNTDAIERLRIHYGTSFGYPMSAVAAHVSACPNHQNGRVTPFRTRGICAMQGSFGYELDLNCLTPEEVEEAKRQLKVSRTYADLFIHGDYRRLSSPFENRDFTAWSYVLPDRSCASFSVVYTDLHGNSRPQRVTLKGLESGASYQLSWVLGAEVSDREVDAGVYTGAALMRGGIILPKPVCDYDSRMAIAKRIS